MAASQVTSLQIYETLAIPEGGISPQTRTTILKQTPNAIFPIPLTSLRVWDAMQTNLPGTAATDDLALISGTFATAPPTITAGDVKSVGATTRYARFEMWLPECYDAGETITLTISAGVVTTIADTSCTVDVQCYKIDSVGGIGSDLCATAATTINSLTFGDKSFTITPTGLVAGDKFDVRIAIATTDAATGTAVTPTIGAIDLVCDIKG